MENRESLSANDFSGDNENIGDRVIREYSQMVYTLAYAQTQNRFDADDVFQEVFLKYIKKKTEFESKEHEKAWFIRVTINCCKDIWRMPYRKHISLSLDEQLCSPYEMKEISELEDALLTLPEKYRAVLHLFYYEDMPIKEIAQIMKSSQAAIKMKLTRARKSLEKSLKERGFLD